MKRCVWILLVTALIGAAYADEKEPPSLSLDEPEEFSFSFDSEPTVLDSKAPKEVVPWLGLWLQETDLLEKALEAEGVRIYAVAPLGPAYKAGLRKDDILTHWNDEAINDADALRLRISALKVGEEISLTIYREKTSQKLKVQADDRANYPWWEEWQPYLPTFDAADNVNKLFQDHDSELEAMKAKFEEATKKASRRDAETQRKGNSTKYKESGQTGEAFRPGPAFCVDVVESLRADF